jgi:signal transduction histidine kinase
MKTQTILYWRRIVVANVIAAAIVLFAFSGATWRTPAAELVRGYGISFLFATCIGPMLGFVMPRIAPWIWRRLRFPFNWVAIAAVMSTLAMLGSAVAIGVLIVIEVIPPREFLNWLAGSARISIAITLTVGLFVTGYELMRARLAQASAEARLAALESRVQPHFLFNTLNSIAALIPEDPKGAERMTGQLASLLRSSLDQQAPVVPMEDELRIARDYLAIEQVRFGNRLRWTIDVDPAASGAGVPRLAVQTLVENAVKFAVTPRREGAAIAIRAGAENGRLRIEVDDDGPGFDTTKLPEGHGLALLRDRLALQYGDRAALQIERTGNRTRLRLIVPQGNGAFEDSAPARHGGERTAQAARGDTAAPCTARRPA